MTIWETLLPGSKARRSLPTAGGPNLPLWLVRGGEEGPTLAVTAGVHGCEYAGIQAVRRLYESVEPGALRGRLLLIPLANPGGFYAEQGCGVQSPGGSAAGSAQRRHP